MVHIALIACLSLSALFGQTSCELAPNLLCRLFCDTSTCRHVTNDPIRMSCCSSSSTDACDPCERAEPAPNPRPCDCPPDCPLRHPPEYTPLRNDTASVAISGDLTFDLTSFALDVSPNDPDLVSSLPSTRFDSPFVSTDALLRTHHRMRC